jgi:predicted outer membrane repeat protein
VWLLLLLNAFSPAAAGVPVVKVAGSSGKTTCSLAIQGNSAGDGIASASLSCTGAGSITVEVHQQLQDVFVQKGVKLAEEGACQVDGDQCLLNLCDSDAVFNNPIIKEVKPLPDTWGVLCLHSASKVTLRKGRFVSNGIPIIGSFSDDVSVLIDQCTLQGNSDDGGKGGAIYFADGSLRVQWSTFKGNAASEADIENGGAVSLAGGNATIIDSTFYSNAASSGGAVAASGEATISIQGSQFVANRASWSGGALYAEGTAQIDILPAAKQGPGVWLGAGAVRLSREGLLLGS